MKWCLTIASPHFLFLFPVLALYLSLSPPPHYACSGDHRHVSTKWIGIYVYECVFAVCPLTCNVCIYKKAATNNLWGNPSSAKDRRSSSVPRQVWHDSFMCEMTHSCVRHDAVACLTWLIHRYVRREFYICETWLIHSWGMTHSSTRHQWFIREAWFIHWLIIAFITCNSNLVPLLQGLCTSNPCRFEISIFWVLVVCDVTNSYVRHDWSIRETWLIHMCDMTHSYVWHDSFICVTRLIHMCDMTHSFIRPQLNMPTCISLVPRQVQLD